MWVSDTERREIVLSLQFHELLSPPQHLPVERCRAKRANQVNSPISRSWCLVWSPESGRPTRWNLVDLVGPSQHPPAGPTRLQKGVGWGGVGRPMMVRPATLIHSRDNPHTTSYYTRRVDPTAELATHRLILTEIICI